MGTRAHIVLPEELIAEIDRLAGKRKRSQFVEEAIRERLAHERLGRALKETAGVLDLADYPEWATPEATSAWVHDLRVEDDARHERALRERDD